MNLPRLSTLDRSQFDGRARPYVPPAQLRLSARLKLHRDWAAEIDPVTLPRHPTRSLHPNREPGV